MAHPCYKSKLARTRLMQLTQASLQITQFQDFFEIEDSMLGPTQRSLQDSRCRPWQRLRPVFPSSSTTGTEEMLEELRCMHWTGDITPWTPSKVNIKVHLWQSCRQKHWWGWAGWPSEPSGVRRTDQIWVNSDLKISNQVSRIMFMHHRARMLNEASFSPSSWSIKAGQFDDADPHAWTCN